MLWLFLAMSAAIIWGLDYSLSEKIFTEKISPILLLTFQLLIGSVVFFVAGLSTKRLVSDVQVILNNRTLLFIIFAAVLSFNLGNYLIFLSIQAKNATLAGIVELSYPIFTVLFTWMLFKVNHFNVSTLIGGLTIFTGVVIIGLSSR